MSEGFRMATPTTFTSASLHAPTIQRTQELHEQRAALEAYLLSKVRAKDWHAVQDAGSDIRELDARLDELGRL
jgi:hypothetical protein